MVNYNEYFSELRFLLPEIIWLEEEHFQAAKEMSDRICDEAQQWQTYLNSLAILALKEWLRERIGESEIKGKVNTIEPICYLEVGDFKIGAIATEHILNEAIEIPRSAIDQPEFAAHFYVALEVREEQEEAIVRGFLRYDRLENYLSKNSCPIVGNDCYLLPLSLFDAEINHLKLYLHYLKADAIPITTISSQRDRDAVNSGEIATKLSRWLEGIIEESWVANEELVNPEASLASNLRKRSQAVKMGKLINLGIQLGNKTVALLVTIAPEADDKLGILIQLYPTESEKYLPADLQLSLYSNTGEILQSVRSKSYDNYIQLKPFKGKVGIRFSIEVSIGDISVRENFEI